MEQAQETQEVTTKAFKEQRRKMVSMRVRLQRSMIKEEM